ncbi:MAG TPA: S8 family serine peptidase, partial [Chloroflexota bacterium]|nr:S8 family serine peptidase [Chloroflexota bacterium]
FAPDDRAAPPQELAPGHLAGENALEDAYIVVLKEGTDSRSTAAAAGVDLRYVYETALKGFAAKLTRDQLVALRRNRAVAFIEQDQVVTGLSDPTPDAALATVAATSGTTAYVSQLDGSKCLDVNGAQSSAGTPLILWSCHGGSNQQWTHPPVGVAREVRVYGDMCLDAYGGKGNDGDAIIIWPCHGGANQRWTLTAAGELKGINGKCVDVYGARNADGTPLVLWTCHGGSNQKWQTTGSSSPPPPGDITQFMDSDGNPWGLDRIDQRSGPLSNTYTYRATGSGVYVYVVDTGLEADHPEFEGRARNVYDAFGGDGSDCNGHGTHVGGIIGGKTFGVAKQVQLRGVKVMDCDGVGSVSGLIAAVEWVRQNHTDPAVANLSVIGGYSSALNSAVDELANSGVFVTAAAGNDDDDACNYSPASASRAFTVAASIKGDSRASYSNYGSCVASYAPGSGIRSADLRGGTATLSGTSMASPHAAGVAALYKEMYGDDSSTILGSWLRSNATGDVIQGNVSGTPNRLLYKPLL